MTRLLLLILLFAFSSNIFAVPPIKKQGTIVILHTDDFVHGKSTHQWVLHGKDGKDTKLKFKKGQEPKPGTEAEVTGAITADGSLSVETITPLPSVTLPTTSYKALFIAVRYSDGTGGPSIASLTTTANSVQAYFTETSYGQVVLTPTVFEAKTTLVRPATCNYSAASQAADTAATAAGYNVSSYRFRVYYVSLSGCGWIGLAYLGGNLSFVNNGASGQVSTHEMGHNILLDHSGTTSCVGVGCGYSEYADPYSTMGNKAMMHYTASQKAALNWLTGSQIAVYPGSGMQTYTLSPYESAGGTTYAIKVPTPLSTRTYWLEYRRKIGFDANVAEGVQVRLAYPFEYTASYDQTLLFNPVPSMAGNFILAKRYTDPKYNISMEVLSADANGAVVSVGIGPFSAPAGLRVSP